MRRIIAITFIIAMALGIVACTPSGPKGKTIPLDVDMDNKPTLNIHLQTAGMDNTDFNKEPTVGLLEELTGYKVNYTQLPAVEDTQALELAWMNRSPYHAIKITKAQYNGLMAKDALLDIRPALERYGQDMLSDITKYSWNVVSRGEGIYGIPEGGPPTEGQLNVDQTIIFRKDLLKDEGFNLPSTRDEFVKILRHFKAKNGSMYTPFSFSNTDSLIAPIAVSFGIYQEWVEVDGEWKYYLELPEYKEYMNFMISLRQEGLIDPNVVNAEQDKSKPIAKFASGQAIAVALSVWDTDKLVNDQIGAKDIDVIKGLLDPQGKIRTFHNGGYPYITVIPWYMNEEAAYTVDWLNKKIKDENFKRLVIGEENVHYVVNDGQYRVLDPVKFKKEKNMASFFCTGINELKYPDYFLCRIDGQVVKDFFLYLNENADEEGTYNPLNFTSLLPKYDKIRISLEEWASKQAMNMMFNQRSISDYDSVLAKWRADGGAEAKVEIKQWCDNNWIY